MREFFFTIGVVGDDLAGAEEFPFVNQKAFETDGAAGVNLRRADANFRA